MHAARDIIVKCRKSFAGKISEILSETSLTLTGLAEKTETSRSQLQRVIQGKVTLDAMVAISDSLGYEIKFNLYPKRINIPLKKRHGQYTTDSGHKFWLDTYIGGIQKTVLVHRELMEKSIGRTLGTHELVHHKNNVPDDNRIENLEISNWSDHARHHARYAKRITVNCLECGKDKILLESQIRRYQTLRKEGPFCGRSCAGRWSQRKRRTPA